MRTFGPKIKIFLIAAATMLLGAMLGGCSAFSGGTSDVTDTYISEFHDVPIPRAMKVESGHTEIADADGIRSGHMRFSGNVEWLSLINANLYNMHAQGWSPIALYKQKNGLLVFEKDQRVCVMVITDSFPSTLMRVWVSPRMHGFTVPPTMPVGPTPVEAVETYQQVDQSTPAADSYQPGPAANNTASTPSSAPMPVGGGANESGLSE